MTKYHKLTLLEKVKIWDLFEPTEELKVIKTLLKQIEKERKLHYEEIKAVRRSNSNTRS